MAIDNKEMEFTEEEIAYILSSISSAPADGYGQVSKNKAIHTTAHRKLIAKIAQKFGVLLNETNNIQETLTLLKDLLGEKQNQSDDTLNTQSKKIVEAINELLGINQNVSIKAGIALDEATGAKTTANDARIVAGIAYENANTALNNSSTALQQAKDYTDEQIANYGLYVVVSELPETGLPNKIYLVPTTNATENNTYDEYLWVNGAWEFQGSGKVDIDLSDTKIKEIVAETYLKGETAPTTETVAQFIGQLYVSGTSTYQCTKITTDESTGVKNYTWVRLIRATDYARESVPGVIAVSSTRGTQLTGVALAPLTWEGHIDNRANAFMSYALLDHAVKVGITANTETLTDEEKTSACDWLGVKKLYCHHYMFRFQGLSGELTFYSTNGKLATTFYDLCKLLSGRRGGLNGYVESIMCNILACEVQGPTRIQLTGVYITGGDSRVLLITESEFEFGIITTVKEV